MIWDYIRHFSSTESWGSPAQMNGLLLFLLDAIRDRWGDAPFVIHAGFESGGHAPNSLHKSGSAVDFHIASSMSLPEQIRRLEMILKDIQVFDRVGLGVYPDWNNPGFHLDCRGSYARWGRIGNTYVGWHDALAHAEQMSADRRQS